VSRVIYRDGWDDVGLQDDLLGLPVGYYLLSGEGLDSILGKLLMHKLLELLSDLDRVKVLVKECENVGVQLGQCGHIAEVFLIFFPLFSYVLWRHI
jgi:hypothetical protein